MRSTVATTTNRPHIIVHYSYSNDNPEEGVVVGQVDVLLRGVIVRLIENFALPPAGGHPFRPRRLAQAKAN